MKKLIFYVSVASFLTIMPIGTKFDLNCEFVMENNPESVLHSLKCRDAKGNASLNFNLNNLELPPPPPQKPVMNHHTPPSKPKRHHAPQKCGLIKNKIWSDGKQYSTEKYKTMGMYGPVTPTKGVMNWNKCVNKFAVCTCYPNGPIPGAAPTAIVPKDTKCPN